MGGGGGGGARLGRRGTRCGYEVLMFATPAIREEARIPDSRCVVEGSTDAVQVPARDAVDREADSAAGAAEAETEDVAAGWDKGRGSGSGGASATAADACAA